MTSSGLAARVETQRPFRGQAWFATLAEQRGHDEASGLAVSVDPTGWVTDVHLASVPDALRTPEGLESAVRRAIADAMIGHLARAAREQELTESERQRARDLLEGRAWVEPRRVTRSPDLVRPTEPFTPPSYHPDERLGREVTGASRDGEVRVRFSLLSGLLALTADPDFLRGTQADLLRHAIREAFTDADRTPEETR